LYALDSPEAKKNQEFAGGVGRLRTQRAALPDWVEPYFNAIEQLDTSEGDRYPGSPAFAAALLREQDRLRLFEMHPRDSELLAAICGRDRRAVVSASDGFDGLKALLPPPSRRALVLIDPPYELKEDYARVVTAVQDAQRRFATGTYAVWYPLLPRPEAARLPQQLAALGSVSLRIELQVSEPQPQFGMHGSGMFVVNPPWRLHEQMNTLLPLLQDILGAPAHSRYLLESGGR